MGSYRVRAPFGKELIYLTEVGLSLCGGDRIYTSLTVCRSRFVVLHEHRRSENENGTDLQRRIEGWDEKKTGRILNHEHLSSCVSSKGAICGWISQ